MDYFYDDYEENEIKKTTLNKNKIIFGVFLAIVIIFLFIYFSPSSRYKRIEKKMVEAAQKYVNDNFINVEREVYFNIDKLDYNLGDSCSKISGVFYDGIDYTPYLYCNKYESEIIHNDENTITLNGKNIIILAKGLYFNDPGYNSKYKINIIGEVGTEEGVYSLNYYDTDNNKVVTRKVVIIDNAEIFQNTPTISLNGNNIVHVFKGERYTEEGVIAYDKKAGVVTDNVVVYGSVNADVTGEYMLVYSIVNSDGYTNSISRMVNVVDKDMNIKVDYLVNPKIVVNTSVNISIKITGNNYDYTILPNNQKDTKNYINYEVEKNGTYTFIIYDKAGRMVKKDIKITNIDKDLPLATCDAVIYGNYTDIIVNSLSAKNTSFYEFQINNQSGLRKISSMYRYNSPIINSASVILSDSIGNTNRINCEITNYKTWVTDFSKAIVFIESDLTNDIVKKYTLDDYLKGAVYKDLIDLDFKSLSSEQLNNLFKTYFIVKKAEAFRKGGYNISLKQLVFRINDADYCDVHSGCKLVSKNNKAFYLSNDIDLDINNVFDTKSKLDDNILSIMNNAYNETKKEILINSNYDKVLDIYPTNLILTDSIKTSILEDVKSNNNYLNIINKYFSGYKIYNINNYVDKYTEPKKIFWWPIGSSIPTSGNIYGGAPETVSILHNYGASITENKIYDYLAINGECNETNVISSWNGVVVSVDSNSEYGNYVIVDHNNGIRFIYGSLAKNSIAVKSGDTIRKGQLIGKIDKHDGNCILYFKALINGVVTNPYDYISSNDTRPASGETIIGVSGSTVKESVCLTLQASGFSNDAIAGIMGNIQSESNFDLRCLGDNGTSYGLLQWHGERYSNLSNFCGNRLNTVDCQLEFMLYEFKNNYPNVYEYVVGNYNSYDIGHKICYSFLKPVGRETGCPKRANIAQNNYLPYVLNGCK